MTGDKSLALSGPQFPHSACGLGSKRGFSHDPYLEHRRLGTLATFALCVAFPCLISSLAMQGGILMHLWKLGTGVAVSPL